MRVGRKDVLIVVDVQNDFVSGTMAIANAENIIGPINRAVQLFEHVVLVTDWHPRQHVSFKSTHGGGEIAMTDYGVQDLHNDHCIQGHTAPNWTIGSRLRKQNWFCARAIDRTLIHTQRSSKMTIPLPV